MMGDLHRIIVFHTAFIGDIVLTLPLVQVLHAHWPEAQLTFVAIPDAAEVLKNHPAVCEVLVYDKKGVDKGIAAFLRLVRRLRHGAFDLAIVPHRSIRSAAAIRLAGIPMRVGFATSAGSMLFTHVVHYRKEAHEIARNLDLLIPLGVQPPLHVLPALYPNQDDAKIVEELMNRQEQGVSEKKFTIALAPGTVWNTKRWPEEYFVVLAQRLASENYTVVLVGGPDDRQLCGRIESAVGSPRVLNCAGRLTLLQSAELIRRCKAIVTNDSAPMHLAVAMRTPVLAIFGATVPEFGFAPPGPCDEVVQTPGLPCRPCSIHGGNSCPIETFVCMKRITPDVVLQKLESLTQCMKSER